MLDEDPRQRLHDIADATLELDDAIASGPESDPGLDSTLEESPGLA